MRKSADSFVLKILFVIIVLVFLFWGVGSMRNGPVEYAARINDQVVTPREFDRAYQNLSNAYRNMAPQGLPAEFLRGQTMAQLVSTELLIQEAQRLGLSVDESELRDSIATIPAFQVDGRFNKENYLEVLRLNGLKPGDFEGTQRRQLLAAKVQNIVRSGVHVSDAELKDRFRFENERVTLRVLRVPAADFLSQVTMTDEDVQAYFTANQERYREPERVRVSLLEFRPQDFAAQVAPSDSEIQAYYDGRVEQYRKPEEVQARHILFKFAPDAPDADKAAARKQAEDVLAKAKGGADFAALAKQHSQDSTAEAGGDLGRFGRGVMTPTFEAAAFALAPGQVSEIVESPFGLHIIKVEDKTAEQQRTLDEVRTEIVTAIQTQQARTLALKKVEAAHEQLLDGADLQTVAGDAGLTLQSPPPFARNEPIGGLGMRPDLAKEVFNTRPGEAGEIVTDPSGYTIFSVGEVIPSAIPELPTVRVKVEADLRNERAAGLATARAEALLTQLKEKPDLDALAQKEGLKIEESADIGRAGTFLPNLGNVPALKDAAFTLTTAAPLAPAVYDANGDAIIAVLAARGAPDDTRFDSEKVQLRQRTQQQFESVAMQNFIDQLKAKATIEYGDGYHAAPEPAGLPGVPS
ncbi:MAG: SurA N-terminal domain-containing protein [Candidatus Binatia bacterium]